MATMLDKDYYLDHTSLFLKNSYGIEERLDSYLGVMDNINKICEGLTDHFNIFSVDEEGRPNYFEILFKNDPGAIEDYKRSTKDAILDAIADIFGAKRQFKVTYIIPTSDKRVAKALHKETDTKYEELVTLKNYELLIYIQLMAVKNNYDGTLRSLSELYRTGFVKDDGSIIQTYCANDLKIRYEPSTDSDPLYCTTRLGEISVLLGNDYTSLIKMFYAGDLTINSLGIIYNRTGFILTYPAFFDIDDTTFLTYGARGQFYEEFNALMNMVPVNKELDISDEKYLYTEIDHITDANGDIITDYTFDGDIITFESDYTSVNIYGVASGQRIENPENGLKLTHYISMFVSDVMVNGEEVDNFTFDSVSQTITLPDTTIAAGDKVYAICDPNYAVFL